MLLDKEAKKRSINVFQFYKRVTATNKKPDPNLGEVFIDPADSLLKLREDIETQLMHSSKQHFHFLESSINNIIPEDQEPYKKIAEIMTITREKSLFIGIRSISEEVPRLGYDLFSYALSSMSSAMTRSCSSRTKARCSMT